MNVKDFQQQNYPTYLLDMKLVISCANRWLTDVYISFSGLHISIWLQRKSCEEQSKEIYMKGQTGPAIKNDMLASLNTGTTPSYI
jgi:hypothetical protein